MDSFWILSQELIVCLQILGRTLTILPTSLAQHSGGCGMDSRSALLLAHCILRRQQKWVPIRTGSDWIRTEANFGRIMTGSDCNFFDNWRIRTGSDWENIFCFNVIILNVSKILVVIRYYRFAKQQCNFAISGKSSVETILPFELYPPLPTYNVEF